METKDYEDLWWGKDSNYLRQMSIQNAKIALQQSKWDFDKALEDYQMNLLSKRINGGGPGLLDRLKDEFEKKGVLTIKNYDKLRGATMDTGGNRWSVDRVEETKTTYYFDLIKRDNFFIKEVRIGLNRVPMAGKDVELYNLWNDKNGNWCGIGKGVIEKPNSLMVKMVELTDE